MSFDDAIRDVEDKLTPRLKLDVWERSLYYLLFRRTHLEGRTDGSFSIQELAGALGIGDSKVREAIRSMDAKGCVRISDRSRKGHLIRVFLPSEIAGLASSQTPPVEPDIEALDFYTSRRYVSALVEREGSKCFYCLRELTVDSAVLDHTVAQVDGVNNSYRNIVASCYSCNSLKQGKPGDEFIRDLYRRGLLSAHEFEDRSTALARLRAGELVPRLA